MKYRIRKFKDYAFFIKEENETVTYWIKVKETGDIVQCTSEQWKELYDMERHDLWQKAKDAEAGFLSYDALAEAEAANEEGYNDCAQGDQGSFQDQMQSVLEMNEFGRTLPPIQRELFEFSVSERDSLRGYADMKGISHAAVNKTAGKIRKKYNEFFS